MKKYETPELELVEYDIEDCLTGSTNIPRDVNNIDSILEQLLDQLV